MKSRRSLKPSTLGDPSRPKVRKLMRAVHVFPDAEGQWEVRTLGPERIRKEFPSRSEAITYAERLPLESTDIVIHEGGLGKKNVRIRSKSTGRRRLEVAG